MFDINDLEKQQIPQELKSAAENYLSLRDVEDKAKEATEAAKQELLELFKKHPHVSSIDFLDRRSQVQKRERTDYIFNKDKVVTTLLNTKHFETVFPQVYNPMNITRVEAEKAGLLNKCLTRQFNQDAITDLLALRELDLKNFMDEGLLTINKSYTVAKTTLKEKKETKPKKTGK